MVWFGLVLPWYAPTHIGAPNSLTSTQLLLSGVDTNTNTKPRTSGDVLYPVSRIENKELSKELTAEGE